MSNAKLCDAGVRCSTWPSNLLLAAVAETSMLSCESLHIVSFLQACWWQQVLRNNCNAHAKRIKFTAAEEHGNCAVAAHAETHQRLVLILKPAHSSHLPVPLHHLSMYVSCGSNTQTSAAAPTTAQQEKVQLQLHKHHKNHFGY
jgi:hypothetical protein